MLVDNFVGFADIGTNGISFQVAGKFVRRTSVAVCLALKKVDS